MLSKENLSVHARLALRLRRAEKVILCNVMRYAGHKKQSCVESCACGAAHECGDDEQVRVVDVPPATGEEEFVRVEGVRVYGSMEERVALETEFRNSVLRGDYRTKTDKESESESGVVVSQSQSEIGSFRDMNIGDPKDTNTEGNSAPSC